MKNILVKIMSNVEASLVLGAFVGAKVGVRVDPVGAKIGVLVGPEGLVKTLEQQERLNPVWKSEQVKFCFPLLAANSRSSHEVVFALFSSCKTLAGSGSN